MSNPIFWQDKKVNFKMLSAILLSMLSVNRHRLMLVMKALSILNSKFDIVIFQ